MNDGTYFPDLGRKQEAIRETEQRRFTKADLDALSVHDDIELRLTDAIQGDVPDGGRFPQGEAPHWASTEQEVGAVIAVWQVLAASPAIPMKLPSWLRKMGISYFRGWIRHAGPVGPDFVMDWVIPVGDDEYEIVRDGNTGPYSPPPGCDLQTFVDAVASFSRDLLLVELERKMRMIGRSPGDPDAVLREFFPLSEQAEV
jgi:hypothetical protein